MSVVIRVNMVNNDEWTHVRIRQGLKKKLAKKGKKDESYHSIIEKLLESKK